MTNITDYFFLGLAGFLYVIGEYKLAFWVSAFGIVNHAGAAVRAIADPNWYIRKRMEANLPVDFFSPRIGGLLVIKIIMIGVLPGERGAQGRTLDIFDEATECNTYSQVWLGLPPTPATRHGRCTLSF